VVGNALLSSNLVVSSNVGIGTTLPIGALHVTGVSYMSSNLGIGVTVPSSALHVNGNAHFTSNVGIGMSPQSSFALQVSGNINVNGLFYQNNEIYKSSQWTTTPGASSIFIINSNVGIGLTNPTSGLHVMTTGYFGCNVTFNSNVSVNGLLRTTGSIASVSDQRIKTNMDPISDPLSRIANITGYIYDRIDTGKRESGLIAQEVQSVLPEVVHSSDGDLLTISYGNLAGLFVEAFKSLIKKIDHLEEEIAGIKGTVYR
jgi:hypothetical protein